jgi:hypothetical protein
MTMDEARRRALIARYREGHQVVVDALGQLDERELDLPTGPDEWTPRQVAHHLADSEMTSALRLRRLLAEDHPTLDGYDEAEFARRLYYTQRPVQASLDALRAARQTSAEILEHLGESEWAREGTHTESGRYTVETWLEIYAAHAHDHAAQILRARRMKPDEGA